MKLTFPKTEQGQYAFPKLSFLGKHFGIKNPYTTGYPKIVEAMWALLDRPKHQWVTLDTEHIRLHDVENLKKCEKTQKGDFLTLSVDLGEKYKGKSPKSVRETVKDELLFSSFHAISVLLQNDKLLTSYEDTFWDIPGDDYNWHGHGFETRCPCFYFDDGQLKFNAYWSDGAVQGFGSAVAFGSVAGNLTPSPSSPLVPSEITIDNKRYRLEEIHD